MWHDYYRNQVQGAIPMSLFAGQYQQGAIRKYDQIKSLSQMQRRFNCGAGK